MLNKSQLYCFNGIIEIGKEYSYVLYKKVKKELILGYCILNNWIIQCI